MCGIVGYLDRARNPETPIGEILYRMLTALSCRGPDSAGVAIIGQAQAPEWVIRIKLGEEGTLAEKGKAVLEVLRRLLPVREYRLDAECLRAVVAPAADLSSFLTSLEALAPGLELISAGTRLEIAKQVGTPESLERSYHIRSLQGSHGIGHTRLSTESRVDLSHSQPFWARGLLDVATVHNGHITNYHKLRRRYGQQSIRFYTENDSEVIGIYLRDRISHGYTFEQALQASTDDFDGSFCYLAVSSESLAYVKDSFALKPLVVAETPEFVAIATEEIALRATLGSDFQVFEPGTKQVQVWSLPQHVMQAV